LARRGGGRAAEDDDPLASRRLETALANEVPGWSATDPEGTAYADPQDGLQRRDRALAAPRALSNIQ
jgi:hypothetical protein